MLALPLLFLTEKFRQLVPVALRAWSILSFDPYMRDEEIQTFVGILVKTLTACGVAVDNARPPILARWDARDVANVQVGMRTAARAAFDAGKMDPQLVVLILPAKDARLYEEIKRWAMMAGPKPVATQCLLKTKISGERAERGLPQYCQNVRPSHASPGSRPSTDHARADPLDWSP